MVAHILKGSSLDWSTNSSCLFATGVKKPAILQSVMTASTALVTRYSNCKVVYNGHVFPGDVWVREGKIINPRDLFYRERKRPDHVVDCRGLTVAPGFIDIQINGAFGVDFSSLQDSNVSECIDKVAEGLLKYGVTSFCPTIVTSPPEYYKKVLTGLNGFQGSKNRAHVLGFHLEGPFISLDKRGAHNKSYVLGSLSPDALLDCYHSLDNVRIITLAPELLGAVETIHWLKEKCPNKNITVSLGHSSAHLREAEEGVRTGAKMVTHLFNAMLPFHHRDPGMVGLLTSLAIGPRPIFFGLITDGIHTHETVQRIAFKANPQGIILVTDGIAATGLPDGDHILGDMKVTVKGNVAKLSGTDTLAGSVATMDKCVIEFKKATDCTLPQAIEAATLHPAQLLGLDVIKGTLSYGADADLVFLDDSLGVQATCVAGNIAWQASGGDFGDIVWKAPGGVFCG